MIKVKEDIITIGWALKIAKELSAKIFWGCILVSTILALLPSIALQFNKETVSILSNFLSTGKGSFSDVIPSIITLGIVLIVIGLSQRINGNFLEMLMHDTYYFGFEEYLMDRISEIELKTLMDKRYQDDYFSTLSRCGSLSSFISAGCLFISKLVGAIALLIVAAQVSLVIFSVAFAYIVAIIILNFRMVDKLRWDHRVYQEASRLSDYYQGSSMSPGVAKEMRIYNLSQETRMKWKSSYKNVEKILERDVINRQILNFISSFGFVVLTTGMMGYSIFMVSKGSMTVDVFLMLYALCQSVSQITSALSQSFTNADNGLFFLKLQRKFLQSVPKTEEYKKEGFTPIDRNIVFDAKELCFSYDGNKDVLHDLTFSIHKGETVALVGHNGSGKTTLVKLLIGLFAPTSGDLCFYGNPYDARTRGGVIKRVGMFFQDFHIFHATFRENVGFGDLKNLDDDERIIRAIEKGGADKVLARFHNGLEQWLQKHVKKDGVWLSGGENQRVAVSRAHMSDKEILIFDEPASALDPVAEMEQFRAIQEKISGRTAILISHRVGFARLADRILVLDGGHLAEDGTHQELMLKNGIYANFFNEQSQWYKSEGNHE